MAIIRKSAIPAVTGQTKELQSILEPMKAAVEAMTGARAGVDPIKRLQTPKTVTGTAVVGYSDIVNKVNEIVARLNVTGTAENDLSVIGQTSINNFGVGTTPNVGWYATAKVIQLGETASEWGDGVAHVMSNNYYYDGTNFRYLTAAATTDYYQYAGTHNWRAAATGTVGATFTPTQVLALGKGTSLALEGATSQTGTGITFPATQSASTNANTIDDYEEGTWTPSSGTTNVTAVEQTGGATYTKSGRWVNATCYVLVTNSTGAGIYGFQLNGLPFTQNATHYGLAAVHYNPAGFTPYTSNYSQANNTYALMAWSGPVLANAANAIQMITFSYQV